MDIETDRTPADEPHPVCLGSTAESVVKRLQRSLAEQRLIYETCRALHNLRSASDGKGLPVLRQPFPPE